MEIKGKIKQRLTPVVGKSSKGDWVKQEIILETAETYPKKVVIGFWKDLVEKIQAVPLESEISVQVNVESREYNGKYYTEVKAWKFEELSKPKNEFKPTDHDLPIEPPF